MVTTSDNTRPPSLALVVVLVAVAALVAGAPLADPDEYMHAALGRWMVAHGQLTPTPDPLVWSDRGGDSPHEWLAQLGMGWLVRDGDLMPLRGLKAATVAAAALLMVGPLWRRRVASAWATAAVLGWLLLVVPHMAMRPHLLAWLPALWWTLWALPSARPWSRRQWLGAAALLALWANLHSSVLIAPLYAACWWAGAALIGPRPLRFNRERGLRTALATAMACCQPMGWHIVAYAWRSQAINARWSLEWQPLWAADVAAQMPLLLGAWCLVAVLWLWLTPRIWRARRLAGTVDHADWAAGWLPGLFAIVHAAATRRMTLFLAVPIVWIILDLSRRQRQHWGAWAAALLALGGLTPWVAAAMQPGAVDEESYPQEATAFLTVTRPQGRLANPDPWGGWLAWHLHPPQQVMADGRWLLGGPDVIAALLALQARAPQAEQVAAQWDIEVFIQRTRDAARAPPLDPQRWLLAWRDKTAVVWLRQGRHAERNIRVICAFYAERPALLDHTRWPTQRPPRRFRHGEAWVSAADVPSVLQRCAR